MARRLTRGDVYLHRFARPDKRRPVVLLGRQEAIDVLREVMVAPVSSTVRGIPSEVVLGIEHGMKGPCAVNLDHVQTVKQSDLRTYIGSLDATVMDAICRALEIAAGCG